MLFRLPKKVQELAPEAKGNAHKHSVIHRYALASRNLITPLKEVPDSRR